MNSLMFRLRSAVGRRLGSSLVQLLLGLKTEWLFAKLYGDFHFGMSLGKYTIKGLAKESGNIYGAIVKFLREIPEPLSKVLLPGENNTVKPVFAALLGIDQSRIVTAGVLGDMDVPWNFEQDPPAIGPFQCLVSQSMIEPLIDPYKHIRDRAALLRPGWLSDGAHGHAGLQLSSLSGGLFPLLSGLVQGSGKAGRASGAGQTYPQFKNYLQISETVTPVYS